MGTPGQIHHRVRKDYPSYRTVSVQRVTRLRLLTHQIQSLVFQVKMTMVEVYKTQEKCGKAKNKYQFTVSHNKRAPNEIIRQQI